MVSAVPELRIWLIDDTLDHLRVADATIASFPGLIFQGFSDPITALAAYARLAREQPALLPRIVLMDFYLGTARGDRVTRELRDLQDAACALIIVGYSSVASCSERIVAAGGNLVVRKTADRSGRNPHLARYLEQYLSALQRPAPRR